MKIKKILLTLLLLIPLNAFSDITAEEQEKINAIKELCNAKADVTVFTYRYRDTFSKQFMIAKLDQSWNEVWSKSDNIEKSTYIDMKRIIEDAYRKNQNGDYKRECCTDDIETMATIREISRCVQSQY